MVKRAGKEKSTWVKIKVTGSSSEGSGSLPSDETVTPPAEPDNGNTDVPSVFMTKNIDSASLMKIYQALQWTPSGRVAVKLSTGEPTCEQLS